MKRNNREVTARVEDAVHHRLKSIAAKLHTKPGKLASTLLENSIQDGQWKAFQMVLDSWVLEVTRTRKRLVSHRKRLNRVLDAQKISPAHAETILRLIGRIELQISAASRLRDLLYGIAAGRAPVHSEVMMKRMTDAREAAVEIWQAKNSGKSFSQEECQLADYLLALKILKT